jgi:AraC family transcriptional regulator of adaptative response / DNA-3-methyladenine glycosylase II
LLNGCRTTRIYCREDCPPGRRTLPKNRVRFASQAEAIAAGYRACKVCNPDQLSGPWQPKASASKRDPLIASALGRT